MATTKFSNALTNRVSISGNHVRVTLVANVGTGNGGTSLPCKGCWVQSVLGNTSLVKVSIGTTASATVGIDLPFTSATVQTIPTFIPIDDVAKLTFYSTQATAVVDILYLL